jgi:hypothetical protein
MFIILTTGVHGGYKPTYNFEGHFVGNTVIKHGLSEHTVATLRKAASGTN